MTQNSNKEPLMYKTAGAIRAMADLGLEKTAFLGLGTLAKLGLKGSAKLLGAGVRGGIGLGKGAWRVGTGVSNTLGSGLGSLGKGVLSTAETAGLNPTAAKYIGHATKGLGRDMASFGLLGGGINAALADPGERLNAFGSGVLVSGLGGAAWGLGRNAARTGLRGALGAQKYQNMKALAKPGFFGELTPGASRLKSIGATTLMGGVPTAAAFGVSGMVPGEFPGVPEKPLYQQPRAYYPAVRSMRGLQPNGYTNY